MKLNLKSILKTFKLNESNISMALGAIVVVIVAILITNYFKDRVKGSIPTGGETKTEIAESQTYVVVKGDSLWKIAEKLTGSGYNWTAIAKENNIENPGVITEGQEIKVSKQSEITVETAVKTNDSKLNQADSITGTTYEVVKGDTLWKIAVRAYGDGYRWSEIARENNLVHPNVIHSGNILVLPR